MKPKELILELFANNVVRIRKSKGMSQEELGFRADLHRTYIGRVERAESSITIVNAEKMAKALEVDIAELFKHQQ